MSYQWKLEIFRMRLHKLARLTVSPGHWRHVLAGTFPSLEHAATPFLPHYDLVVDAGASNGQFSTFAMDRWRGADLVCFEPIPECAARTRSLVGDRGVVHQVALGERGERTELILSGRMDSSSLLPVDELAHEVAHAGEVGRIEVQVERLDRYLTNASTGPSLLKIDVQGLELDVLRGAGAALRQFTDVYCECSFRHLYRDQALVAEVVAYLSSQGFELMSIENPARNENRLIVQADLLFRRNDHFVPRNAGAPHGAVLATEPPIAHANANETDDSAMGVNA